MGVQELPGLAQGDAGFRSLRQHVLSADFAAAWEEGQAMTLEQAIAYAAGS